MFSKVFCHRFIGKDFFNACLRVVKIAVYCANVNVAALLRSHLQLLHGAHAVVRVKHHNFRACNVLKALKSRLARIARGCNQYNGFFARSNLFCRNG